MGWTTTRRERDTATLDFFKARFDWSKPDGSYGKVLACSSGATAYMALETKRPEKEVEVIALVVLTKWFPKDPKYNFGWKYMSESMGPYYYDCPAKILDMLTPTTDATSLEWRRLCRLKLEAKKAAPKVTKGTKISFHEPLRFTDGTEHTDLTWMEGNRFQAENGEGYRVKNWRLRQFIVAK